MSIDIERDIDGDSQQDSFQNATLQTGPPGYEFSIAVHVDIPMIGVYDQETLAQFLERTFAPISDDPRVSISIQMGREGSGDYYWVEDLEACAPEALALNTGVEVRLREGPGGHCPLVTLIAAAPDVLMQYIRHHWGSSDETWLSAVEEGIKYGGIDPIKEGLKPLEKEAVVVPEALIVKDVEEDAGEMTPLVEAINNIEQARRVIAPLYESMKQFGHTGADDVAGALSDLDQAVRFLKNEEVPA